MGWRKSIFKVGQDAARRLSIQPATGPTCSSSVAERLRALDRSRRSSPKMDRLRTYIGADSKGILVGPRFQSKSSTAAIVSYPHSTMRIAGIYVGRTAEAVEPTYGVGPVGGADRDPRTKGSTPDDFRAETIHMAEPKEITKEKAAIAQAEPPDFQVKKMMPGWDAPVRDEADSQREPGDKVFEGETRKLKGSAQWEGDTTGTESGDEVQGQYGAGSAEGKTSRA